MTVFNLFSSIRIGIWQSIVRSAKLKQGYGSFEFGQCNCERDMAVFSLVSLIGTGI